MNTSLLGDFMGWVFLCGGAGETAPARDLLGGYANRLGDQAVLPHDFCVEPDGMRGDPMSIILPAVPADPPGGFRRPSEFIRRVRVFLVTILARINCHWDGQCRGVAPFVARGLHALCLLPPLVPLYHGLRGHLDRNPPFVFPSFLGAGAPWWCVMRHWVSGGLNWLGYQAFFRITATRQPASHDKP